MIALLILATIIDLLLPPFGALLVTFVPYHPY